MSEIRTGVSVTEGTFRHPRILRKTFVTVGGLGWEVSSAKLIKTVMEAKGPMDLLAVARDTFHEIKELYEVMIFKMVNGERQLGDYGHYRGDSPDEALHVHGVLVSAIASGKLNPRATPREEFDSKTSSQISKCVPEIGEKGI